MEFNFKSNRRKYFVNLILFSLIVPVIFGIVLFLMHGNFLSSFRSYIVTAGAMGIISTIPLVILYFNYKRYNKDLILKISPNSRYELTKSSEYIEFYKEDIEHIEFILSYAVFDKRASFLLWDSYFYVKIVLKNSQHVYITCIVCDDLSLYFPESIIKRRKIFFPYIR
jgi:hypothetical protein